MPQYEYHCEEDGETLTLLRPIKDADAPVPDPKGLGRRFVRSHSTFSVLGASGGPKSTGAPVHRHGGGCSCGNPHGPCARP